jgi:hypothetical protein
MSYQKDNGTTEGVQDAGESILHEAHRLTHGDRNKDYGHPLDDYSKNAGAINALFKHKLREDFTAADVALIMVVVKLSRQVNRPKRDNMVDAAGYAWVANACIEEKARREEMASIRTNAQCDELVRSVSRLDCPPPVGADGLARALYQTAQAQASETSQRDDSPLPWSPADLAAYEASRVPRALPSEKPSKR